MPENYRGTFSELTYAVAGADPAQTVEVEVLGERDDDILGVKRFRGQDRFSINISNYMRRRVAVSPKTAAGCVALFAPERTAAGRIKVAGTVSPLRVFTAGVKAAQELAPLSDRPVAAQLARGEKDEIAVIVPPGKQVTFTGVFVSAAGLRKEAFANPVTGNGAVAVQAVDMGSLETLARAAGCFDDLASIEIRLDGAPLRTYEFTGTRRNAVRLCWMNPFGAVDYHTFALCSEETITAEKSRIYTESGYKVYDSAARKMFTLQSDYENTATMTWLAQILGSPKVWIAREGGFTPVDVITNSVRIGRMEPSSLRLEVRESMKTPFQNM